jgi:hypothetical protein
MRGYTKWTQPAGIVAAIGCVAGGFLLGAPFLGLLIGVGLLWAAVGDNLAASSHQSVRRATLVFAGVMGVASVGLTLVLLATGAAESPHNWLRHHPELSR